MVLAAIKLFFITVTTLGVLFAYSKIFWDDDWDWSAGGLLFDLISLLFFMVMMCIWPFRPRSYKRRWGPVSFFAGFAFLLVGFGTITAFTMGWADAPTPSQIEKAVMPTLPAGVLPPGVTY